MILLFKKTTSRPLVFPETTRHRLSQNFFRENSGSFPHTLQFVEEVQIWSEITIYCHFGPNLS